MDPGLTVVFEGKRVRVHIIRRFFEPHTVYNGGREVNIYSDTGVEREVTQENAEDYGLDNPLKLIALIRLAKSMDCLKQHSTRDGLTTYRITISRAREIVDPNTKNDDWVPFDPRKTKGLEEKMSEAKKRAKWSERFRPGRSTA